MPKNVRPSKWKRCNLFKHLENVSYAIINFCFFFHPPRNIKFHPSLDLILRRMMAREMCDMICAAKMSPQTANGHEVEEEKFMKTFIGAFTHLQDLYENKYFAHYTLDLCGTCTGWGSSSRIFCRNCLHPYRRGVSALLAAVFRVRIFCFPNASFFYGDGDGTQTLGYKWGGTRTWTRSG